MVAGDGLDGGENAFGGPAPRARTEALWAGFWRDGSVDLADRTCPPDRLHGVDRGPSIRVGFFHQPLKSVESREPITTRGTYVFKSYYANALIQLSETLSELISIRVFICSGSRLPSRFRAMSIVTTPPASWTREI